MKTYVLFFILVLAVTISIIGTGCVYDPPQKGKILVFENQTDSLLFVADSAVTTLPVFRYDTILVNNESFIYSKPNWISGYGNWEYFLSEIKASELAKTGIKNLLFTFINEGDLMRNGKGISHPVTGKKFLINLEELKNNEINYIFYKKDTVYISHKYNITSRR